MRYFISHIKRICFIGSECCNQGGGNINPPVIVGVVNNGIQVVHNGIVVTNNGI